MTALHKRLLEEALPAHNEAISGDSLFSIQLNYKWRMIIAQLLHQYFTEDNSDTSYDNQNHLSALINDLYDAENIGNLVHFTNVNIPLTTNKTTTSGSFVAMAATSVTITPVKENCQLVIHNLLLLHSVNNGYEARIMANHGTIVTSAMAVGFGTGQKSFTLSIDVQGLTIGVNTTFEIQWRVTAGGTATANAASDLVYEFIQYD